MPTATSFDTLIRPGTRRQNRITEASVEQMTESAQGREQDGPPLCEIIDSELTFGECAAMNESAAPTVCERQKATTRVLILETARVQLDVLSRIPP